MADKKGINSKAKGTSYELKIAKVLSSWWGEEFHRTPMSGGLGWKADNRVAGDIVTPVSSVYPWTTELKNREAWDFSHLLKGTGDIEKYWQQVVNDSEHSGLRPLLIFHKNFSPNYVMMYKEDFDTIFTHKGVTCPFNYFIASTTNVDPRVICILDEFICHVTPKDIIGAFNL